MTFAGLLAVYLSSGLGREIIDWACSRCFDTETGSRNPKIPVLYFALAKYLERLDWFVAKLRRPSVPRQIYI